MQIMLRSIKSSFSRMALSVLGLFLCAPCLALTDQASVPASTTLPVRFIHSVDAKKARPGDLVTAKTMQLVSFPNGKQLPKGALVLGHVVEAQPFQSHRMANEQSRASLISVHFDQIQNGGQTLAVNLSVRALADTVDSYEATWPHSLDETDRPGEMVLIGGGEFSPLDKTIINSNGEVIRYNRRHGVFAKLPPSIDVATDVRTECPGSNSEQSLAIFSPSACGVYGLGDVSMPHAGRSGSGTFTIESLNHNVKLYAGSTALLQEIQPN